MSSDSFHGTVQYIYIAATIKASQYAISMPTLPPRAPHYPLYSTDILCANAVIDTFITSKGIQFSFQSPTGMNSAASSAANNEGAITRSQRTGTALPTHSRGESVSNCLPILSLVQHKWLGWAAAFRQVAIQFYCQTNVIFFAACGW